MSHITEVSIAITPADVNSGILERAIAKALPGASLVKAKTTLNDGRSSAWQKIGVDAYIDTKSTRGAHEIGFQVDAQGNYKLVGDFMYQPNFAVNFGREFLEEKITTVAQEQNWNLVNSYTNPENAAERVYEYETN